MFLPSLLLLISSLVSMASSSSPAAVVVSCPEEHKHMFIYAYALDEVGEDTYNLTVRCMVYYDQHFTAARGEQTVQLISTSAAHHHRVVPLPLCIVNGLYADGHSRQNGCHKGDD